MLQSTKFAEARLGQLHWLPVPQIDDSAIRYGDKEPQYRKFNDAFGQSGVYTDIWCPSLNEKPKRGNKFAKPSKQSGHQSASKLPITIVAAKKLD